MIYNPDTFPLGGLEPLPVAYNGCICPCHRVPGVKHCMPCCWPTQGETGEPRPAASVVTYGGFRETPDKQR